MIVTKDENSSIDVNPIDVGGRLVFFKEDTFLQNALFEGINIYNPISLRSMNIDTLPGYKIKQYQYDNVKTKNLEDLSCEKHDFRSINEEKLLVYASPNFYHFFIDTMPHIAYFHKKFPDALIIIHALDIVTLKHWSLMQVLTDYLKANNIKHMILTKSYFLAINNFYVVNCTDFSDIKMDLIYDIAKTYIEDINKKPTKKVYLSRKNVSQRIQDEEILENFLKEIGFEIVFPEDFKDFKEQANFFNDVHTLISATSAGITNSIFMQPGGVVIELIVPKPLVDPIPGMSSIHSDHFLLMCFNKKHKYFGIRTPRNSNDIVEYIKNDISILDFIVKR
jgi:hypothetical protein